MASDDNVVRIKHLATCACAIAGLSSHTCLSRNADNVLRLKHLQTFANSLDCDISFNNPDNAAKLKHLTALASALASNSSSITISSFSIEPSNLSIVLGDEPVTASASVITDPADCDYQLSIPDAPDWISIDNNIISFAPTSDTTPDTYSFTVVATTKDDRAEFAITLDITKREPISPNLKLQPHAFYSKHSTVSSAGNITWNAYSAAQDDLGAAFVEFPFFVYFDGEKGNRTITVSGTIANATKLSASSSDIQKNTYGQYAGSKISFRPIIAFNDELTTKNVLSGSTTGTLTVKISGNDTYSEESRTLKTTKGYAKYTMTTKKF